MSEAKTTAAARTAPTAAPASTGATPQAPAAPPALPSAAGADAGPLSDTAQHRSVATQWTHEVQSWLDPSRWPQPAWAGVRQRRSGLHRYDSYVLHQTRVRYLELETDFRTVFGNWAYGMLGGEPVDVVTGQCAVELLHGARRALEQPDPDLLAVGSTLDLIERCIVWATPSYLLVARIPGLRRRVERELQGEACEWLQPLLQRLSMAADGRAGSQHPPIPLHELRSAIDEATVVLNTAVTERQITSGLQLERLTILRDRGLALLALLAVLLPMLMPVAGAAGARLTVPFVIRFVPLPASDAWLAGLAVALFGAAGGFLSGLLQARASTVTTAEYQDSLLRLELRPIVGATIALVLFVLLSWGIVPGVAITSGGSFLLLAFLSGFSERYFLRLLELRPDEAHEASRAAAAGAAAAAARESAPARAPLLRPTGGGTPLAAAPAPEERRGPTPLRGRVTGWIADGAWADGARPVRAGDAPGVPETGELPERGRQVR